MLLLSHLSLQKNRSVKQRLIQRNLKALDARSLKNVGKRTIVELYNHYLHYSTLCLHCTRSTVVTTLVFLYTWNEFEIVPS